jgi:hypothetical protein
MPMNETDANISGCSARVVDKQSSTSSISTYQIVPLQKKKMTKIDRWKEQEENPLDKCTRSCVHALEPGIPKFVGCWEMSPSNFGYWKNHPLCGVF